MTTEEKIKLYNDARFALHAVGRILDGGHKPENIDGNLRDDCFSVMGGLVMTITRLEAEVGTDNL
jgi:hypothetical protein